jgi:hypothetical protein
VCESLDIKHTVVCVTQPLPLPASFLHLGLAPRRARTRAWSRSWPSARSSHAGCERDDNGTDLYRDQTATLVLYLKLLQRRGEQGRERGRAIVEVNLC